MQMVKKGLGIFFAVWLALVLFMPKAELYYAAEKMLAKYDIKLNEKHIDEGLFSLTVKDVTVYVKGIALASIDELDFFTLLFYTKVDIKNLLVDEALQSKVPANITKATLSHTILSPLIVSVDANGSFGVAEGKISLLDKKVHINFSDIKDISMMKSFLKKDEKGWLYEESF